MSKRIAAKSAATARRRWRSGLGAWALALLMLTWTGAPGDVQADTIVLKDGEVLEGSIVDATRNTVIVRPAIGGMRQMPIRNIAEVRIDLAQGQRISGQLLSWAGGIYRVRSGDQVIQISEGDILSREPGEQATGQPPGNLPSRPVGRQTMRMAAGPATPPPTAAARAAPAGEQRAAQLSEGEGPDLAAGEDPGAGAEQRAAVGQKPSPPAGEKEELAALSRDKAPPARREQSPAVIEQRRPAAVEQRTPPAAEKEEPAAASQDQTPAAGAKPTPEVVEQRTPAAGEKEKLAAVSRDQTPAAGAKPTPEVVEQRRPAAGEKEKLAALSRDESPATDERRSLAIRASVEPAEPGADNMVFKIELSRPAEQTLVLIYGTVEGTAKAGEDFEPQQGMVTLTPGTKSAEVRVPLIEHSSSTGEKRFELFLTADPKVAEVVDRRITATIDGGN